MSLHGTEKDQLEARKRFDLGERCHSNNDGECEDKRCPQLRDGEPVKSGRHCPLDSLTDREDQ